MYVNVQFMQKLQVSTSENVKLKIHVLEDM